MTIEISFKRNDWICHTGPLFFGHFCRGRWIQMPGHSDFGIFNHFGASSIFTWVLADTESAACPTQPSNLEMISMIFCCRHLWCRWSLFCKYCTRSRIIFYYVTSECNSTFVIFGALSPIRHSSNDRCPSVRQNELLCPSSLLHRSPLIYFWLLSCPTQEYFQVSRILYPLLRLLRVSSLLEA